MFFLGVGVYDFFINLHRKGIFLDITVASRQVFAQDANSADLKTFILLLPDFVLGIYLMRKGSVEFIVCSHVRCNIAMYCYIRKLVHVSLFLIRIFLYTFVSLTGISTHSMTLFYTCI